MTSLSELLEGTWASRAACDSTRPVTGLEPGRSSSLMQQPVGDRRRSGNWPRARHGKRRTTNFLQTPDSACDSVSRRSRARPSVSSTCPSGSAARSTTTGFSVSPQKPKQAISGQNWLLQHKTNLQCEMWRTEALRSAMHAPNIERTQHASRSNGSRGDLYWRSNPGNTNVSASSETSTLVEPLAFPQRRRRLAKVATQCQAESCPQGPREQDGHM